VIEKLDRISELAWETRGDWIDLRNNMREICHLVEEIKQAGYLSVEPVKLEVLSPETMSKVIQRDCTKWDICSKRFIMNIASVISQATIAHNRAKGQLYRKVK